MVGIKNFLNVFKTTTTTANVKVSKNTTNMKATGTSGTEIYSGYFDEEYLQKLTDSDAIIEFDQMRRSDGQVKMLLSVIKNPIRSATWDIESASDDKQDKEIAAFVKYVLFKNMGTASGSKRKTFNEFISEALTAIEFGHSAFEIVHKVVKGDKTYGDFIGISDLGFRHQRSLEEWGLNEDGSINWIRQSVDGDLAVDIYLSGQHMLIFSMEKEGDNYQGISMLRPCYGSYFRKNIYRKLQAIGIERCAKGIPVGKVPTEMANSEDYQDQLDSFQEIIDKLAAHETNGIVLGAGFDLTELKISHDAESVQKVINAEDIEMSKSFLANFMELGLQGNSGSFSLGSDLSDLFLTGIQYIANGIIAERINLDLIEQIVKAKYGEQDNYPKLRVTGINDKAGKELAEIVASLLDKDAIQASTRLQRHMHKVYKLPEIDDDIADITDERLKNPATENDKTGNIESKKKLHEERKCMNGHIIYRLSSDNRKDFPVSAKIEDYADDLNRFMRSFLQQRASDMLVDVAVRIKKGGKDTRKDVLNIRMPNSKAYQTSLKEWVSSIVDEIFFMTVKEVGLDTKKMEFEDSANINKLPEELKEKLTALTILVAEFQDIDFEKAIYFSFNENYGVLTDQQLINELKRKIDTNFNKNIIETTSVNMAANVVNSTRKETFLSDAVFDEIESFVFNNPSPVSAICKHLNGRVFTEKEYATTPYDPPLHHNCYDKETEVMTDTGFKLFSDVDINKDKFLSLDTGTQNLEYVEADDFIKYNFDGELYHFTNNQGSLSQCVTPDHPMFYSKRVDYGSKGRVNELMKSDIEQFIKYGNEAKIYCSSDWIGSSKGSINIDGGSYNTEGLLKFMGYYLSEGHVNENGRIIITQHKEHSKAIMYKDLSEHFDCLEWSTVLAVKDDLLREYVREFGKSYQKHIPKWIKVLTKDQINIFLDAYCLGDGTVYKDRKCFTGETTYRVFATSSKRMASDLSELLIKSGRSASMRIISKRGKVTKHHNGEFAQNHDVYIVADLSSKRRNVGVIEKIPYNDFVYDVSLVKNHTLLIKRNGCISWGSNCKSYISAQTSGDPTNKPITTLKIKGNNADKEKILRSKTL